MTTPASQKFLVSVVPLVRIPLTRDQAFFYIAKEQISFGTLVQIPIGKRLTKGIVISCKKDFSRVGGMELKPVEDILEKNILTQQQYDLAQFISHYYFTSLGVVLKNFVPTPTKPRTKDTSPDTPITPLPTLGKSELACKKDALRILGKKGRCLVETTYNAFALEWLLHIIQEKRDERGGSIVIFVPERTLIPLYAHALHSHFPHEDIITLTSAMTKGHFYERWEKIRRSNNCIILATRVGLFAPYHDLSLVITAQSHDMSHKQWEKNPRYDVRTCAPHLAKLHGAQHLSLSASPRIADLHAAHKNNYFVALPQNSVPQIKVVDMKYEYFAKNKDKRTKKRPLLSEELIVALRNNLTKGQQSLLFINHQGKNAFSTCTKCKTILRCETCERALVERSSGKFSCLHCSFSTDIFPRCPTCSNLTFTSIGTGTEQIESMVQKHFPKATVARVDSESMKKARSYDKLFNDFYTGKIDILIGTQMATKGWDVPNLTLAAIIDMDHLLGGTDYDTDEKAYAHILQLGSRVGMRGTLIIQTFDTLHGVLTAAQKHDRQDFVTEELDMRKILHYPPYAQIIKLLYQDNIKKDVDEAAERLHTELAEMCGDADITVSEPHDPLVNKVRTRWRKQIILTIKKENFHKETPLPQSLHDKLITLDAKWTIDVNPIQIS